MKRILTIALVLLMGLCSQSFASRTATFGDQNSAGVYRVRTDRDDSTGAGYVTYAQDTGIVYPYLTTPTTNFTLTAFQSGSVYILDSAVAGPPAANTTFTLPTATVGLQYTFIADVSTFFRVAPQSTDIIRLSTAVAGNKVRNSGAVGDSITLFCAVAGFWSISDRIGTWTVDTTL